MVPINSVSELINAQYGINVRPRVNPITDTVGVAATQILTNNPKRVGFTIVNLSANAMWVMYDNGVLTTRGVYLAPAGGSMSLNWRDDMQLPSWEWWAIAGGAGSLALVMEIVLI